MKHSEKIEAYECDRCGEIHKEEYMAILCCAPNPKIVDAYKCIECDHIYGDEKEAEECCAQGDEQ